MAADEKTFSALGQNWTARFDFNAICEIEERYDRPFLDLVAPFMAKVDPDDEASAIAAASSIKFSDLRVILHQSLLSHHPDATIAKAGEIIGDLGLDRVMPIIAWAITAGMPAPKGDGGNVKKTP